MRRFSGSASALVVLAESQSPSDYVKVWKNLKGKVLPILTGNESVLRTPAKHVPVKSIKTRSFQQMLANMEKTALNSRGAGIAAPQVNKPWRVFLYDPSSYELNERENEVESEIESLDEEINDDNFETQLNLEEIINPEITWKSEKVEEFIEACLSVPGIYGPVNRSSTIKVTYFNSNAEKVEKTLSGGSACVFQHEYDHLNGVLFIDHVDEKDLFIEGDEEEEEEEEVEDKEIKEKKSKVAV